MDRFKLTPPLFGLLLALEFCALALLARYSDFTLAGNPQRFVALALVSGAFYLAAVAAFETLGASRRPKVFWTAAVLFRLAVLPMEPGDDFPRYIWEGQVQLAGLNPYLVAPSSATDDPLARRINHPDSAAIYPPATELFFRFMARCSAGVAGYKIVFAVADLLTVLLLLRLNTGAGRYRLTAWYAWNPLVIYSFAGTAHFDSLMVLALVVALWALHRANPLDAQRPAWSWAWLSAFFLGLAISLKVVPLLLVPVWIAALRGRSVVLIVTLALPAGLALIYGGVKVVVGPLLAFTDVARFNDPLCWLIELVWADPGRQNTHYNLLVTFAAVALAIFFRHHWRRAVLWALGAALIFTPVLHPWYITWILPVAAWRREYAWYVLSLTIFGSLVLWEAGPFWRPWQTNAYLRLCIFMPPLAAWWWLRRRRAAAAEA